MPFQHMPARKTPGAAFENRPPGACGEWLVLSFIEGNRTISHNHDIQETTDNQTKSSYQYSDHTANDTKELRRNIYQAS